MYQLALITGQFCLAAAIFLSAQWRPLPWMMIVMSLPGVVLAIWAWWTMGLRRLRVHPTTSERTRLLQTGPYAIVRHPMYTGLLWVTLAIVISQLAWWRLAMWCLLLGVLFLKSREEEHHMRVKFSDYDAYAKKVGKLLPHFPR